MIPDLVEPRLFFEYYKGKMYCEGVCLEELASQAGTPCYVYSREQIRASLQQLQNSFSTVNPRICYAVKANSNLSLLQLMNDAGVSFDIVSWGEASRLKRIGVGSEKIFFSGVGKNPRELQMAISESINCLTVESIAELEFVARLSRQLGKSINIGLRLIPDVFAGGHPHISTGMYRHKFGIDPEQIHSCLTVLRNNPRLKLVGIGSHIGSQIMEHAPFISTFTRILEIADQLRDSGLEVDHLNLGGGFGVPYSNGPEFDFQPLANFISEHQGDYRIILEPGRYLIARAGILLCSVLYLKQTRERKFVVLDAGINDLLRPALYGAFHNIRPVLKKDLPAIPMEIVGPVCESSDIFASEREITELTPGEILAIMDTGAYGFVASSNYNSRCRPPEVLVEGTTYRLIRRRETISDLILDEADLIV